MSHQLLAVLCLLLAPVLTRRISNILYDKYVLPDDSSVSLNLTQPDRVVKLFYLLQKDVEGLTVTVTPCGTPVYWDLHYRSYNQTGKVETEGGEEARGRGETEQRHRVVSPATKGLYTLELSGRGRVEVFATFLGPPHRLYPTGRAVARSATQPGHVLIRWSRTTVDPDLTEYVVVVDRRGTPSLSSLCQASVSPPLIMEQAGQKTSWVVRGLEAGRLYRAEVFARHAATNFSYKFAEIPRLGYSRPRPRPLQDGQQVSGQLRPQHPVLLYRYKVREGGRLEMGVTACGDRSLTAEVKLRGGGTEIRRQVQGHAVLVVPSPLPSRVYILKLKLPDGARPLTAQVTVGGEEEELPEPAEVHEFRGLRGCREVTLGWVPLLGQATYCLRATQTRRGQPPPPQQPDQCAVDQELNSLGYSVLQCSDIHSTDRKVVSEELRNLKPGKQYDIQVSVKKGNSKRLSYKLLRVRTKSRCP